jgi:hypothetical protein
MRDPEPDVLICASTADARGLLRACLPLVFRNLERFDRLHLVSSEPRLAVAAVSALSAAERARVRVVADDDAFPEAAGLHPWFRQQYIKLTADRLVAKRQIVCLGADTLILDRVATDELFDRNQLVLRFFRHPPPNPHLAFERRRVINVARALRVEPRRSFVLGDFICDLFGFDALVLAALRARLAVHTSLLTMLRSLGARAGPDDRFGEWTLYAVYLLEIHDSDVRIELAEPTFFRQIHSPWDLSRADRWATRVVHVAASELDPGLIITDLVTQRRLPEDPR